MEMFEIGQEPPMPKETLYDVHEELSLLFTLAKRQAFANNTSIAACLETWPILAPCFSGFSRASMTALILLACLSTIAILVGLQHLFRKGSEPEERRMLAPAIPSAASVMTLEDAYFTPDLVVPDGCECILLIRSKPQQGQISDVIDSAGGVVLRIADTDMVSMGRRKLLSPQGALLGQCGRARSSLPHSATTTFEIQNSHLQVFARLTHEPRQGVHDKCIIETKLDQKLLLFGSIQHQTLNLADLDGRLLATTEPVTQQARATCHCCALALAAPTHVDSACLVANRSLVPQFVSYFLLADCPES
ncbi:unnamed protein product [Symbiodinium natans]|uniref:Uncharacterized protein n=1 Tax=Symbiodinium natans TaxID=878477 RepID=A0A812TQX0_9DINO|nr:unnamed protein product [Symbiodinium natans]